MKEDKASSTAILIAKSLIFSSSDPRISTLLSPNVVELTMTFLRSAIGRWQAWLFKILGRLPQARWLVRMIEKFSVPGMIIHYIIRKRKIEECVKDACEEGAEQLVFFGAGLDTLGFRSAEINPSIKVFEVDHPATQTVKRKAVDSGNVLKPINLTLISADLTKKTPLDVLKESDKFSFQKKTLFVAEGVFMYLTLGEVGTTLDILKKFAKGNSMFLFTYMELDRHGKPGFHGQSNAVNKWLKAKEERFLWGHTPAEIESFLTSRELTMDAHFDGDSLKNQFLSSPELEGVISAKGENLARVIWN